MATINSGELHRIGDGPVATVYSGHRAGVPVALKVFPKRLDKRTLAAYNKEQAKLSAMRSVTSILQVDGVDELDTGELAVRMERCTQSLAALVDRVGQLPPADVVVLGRAVAVALAAAHGAGVVHGGMSPHNILFRVVGEPVLADFGVTLRQAFARDPLYAIEFLPPETLRTGELNRSTDLYGLGAVLHYALSGRSPHPGRLGEQPGERVLRILGEPVPAINAPNVPVGLSTLVARLLATDPARRPNDTGVVADQLGDMLPDAPRRPPVEDFDDFDGPQPVLPPAQRPRQAPPLPPTYRPVDPGNPDDFDDFAVTPYGGGFGPAGSPPPAFPAPPTAQPFPPVGPAFPAGPAFPPAAPVPPPAAHVSPSTVPVSPPAAHVPAPAAQVSPLAAQVPPPTAQVSPLAAQVPVHTTQVSPPAARVSPPTAQVPAPAAPVSSPTAQVTRSPVSFASASQPSLPVSPPPASPQSQPQSSSPASVSPPSASPPTPVSPSLPADSSPASASLSPPPAAPASPSPSFSPPPPAPVSPSFPPASSALPSVPASIPVSPPPPAPSVPLPPSPPAEPPPPTAEAPDRAAQLRALRRERVRSASVTPRAADDQAADAPAPEEPSADRPAQPATLAPVEPARPEQFDGFGQPAPTPPPAETDQRKVRYDVLAGGGLLLFVLGLVLVMTLRSDPEELTASPQVSDSGPAPSDVQVELSEVTDLVDRVELTWQSSKVLDFAVIVAAEGEPEAEKKLADRRTSMTVAVEPGRKYCFLIQGTDSVNVYESDPVPLRGATCRN